MAATLSRHLTSVHIKTQTTACLYPCGKHLHSLLLIARFYFTILSVFFFIRESAFSFLFFFDNIIFFFIHNKSSISKIPSVLGLWTYHVEASFLVWPTKSNNLGAGQYLNSWLLGNTRWCTFGCTGVVMYIITEWKIGVPISNSNGVHCIHLHVNILRKVRIHLFFPQLLINY